MAEKAVKHCPERCLICGTELSYAGIKPVVCEKATCIFSYEQYGLGVDIENEIIKHPDIVDLMITLAHAACTAAKNDFNPFEPYPVGIQVQTVDPITEQLVTHDLKRSNEMDNSKVKNLIEKLPPVSEMKNWVEKGTLKENLFKIDPCAFSLIRWLVASNRCHLKKLEKNEQIKEMNTTHQYLMLSGTPDTEKNFQQLKQKLGTYLGFHGSSACNWHAIMRFGLKNMSGKKGQLHGKAYGDGVYLADAAQTSFGYLKYGTTWSNSSFATNSTTMGIMALCEIIKDKSVKTTPYYVVQNDNLIATRYFFIYEGSGSSSAIGKSLKLPTIQWEKKDDN